MRVYVGVYIGVYVYICEYTHTHTYRHIHTFRHVSPPRAQMAAMARRGKGKMKSAVEDEDGMPLILAHSHVGTLNLKPKTMPFMLAHGQVPQPVPIVCSLSVSASV